MGIRNLSSLLKKFCPESVIRPVASEDFKGQRVAIDGNLLTLRFHFGSSDYKPVGLWYRFLRSLQGKGIHPIVLFDGEKRLPQKQKTLQKRREQRDLLMLRSTHEAHQVQRYSAIIQALDQSLALKESDQDSFKAQLLASWRKGASRPDSSDASTELADSIGKMRLDDAHLSDKAKEIFEAIHPSLGPLALASEEVAAAGTAFQASKSQIAIRHAEANLVHNWVEESAELPVVRAGVAQLHADSSDLATGYKQRTRTVTKEDNEEIETLIRAMGVPLLKTTSDSAHEAEALGAVLYRTGDVAAVFTEDTDVLLYDAPLVKNVVGRSKTPTLLHGKEVREALGFDQDAFIDLCLLCGSDFVQTIPKIGYITAYKLMKEHGSIESILSADAARPNPKYHIPNIEEYLQNLALAREVFQNPPVLPSDPKELEPQPVNQEVLTAILMKYDLHLLPDTPVDDLAMPDFSGFESSDGDSYHASTKGHEEWPPTPDDRF